MRAWPSDDTVAHLIFVDHLHTPTPDELAAAIEHAHRRGARAIRTSAMFPDAASVVLGEGFTQIDRLALLQHSLAARGSSATTPSGAGTPRPNHRIRPMRAWHLTPCSRIDRDAFGLMWGNSPASLRDVRAATPAHRSRLARHDHSIVGFAISGAAGDIGYLQRLAVAPPHQRRGAARELVDDALTWMRRRGADRALVNTGVDNHAALALYESIGFTRLDDELTIAELRLG